MSTIYLIDGSGYIFRAFYAIRPLSTRTGLPTNAIYGVLHMLMKLLKSVTPTHAAVVFDTKEPSFRKALYNDYKANRAAPPDLLVPQFPFFPRVAQSLGLQVLMEPGFEADDVIGTLAKRFATDGHDVIIVTGDKDFMQLVGPRISLWDTMKETRSRAPEVRARFGVDPAQVIDVLGLAGDASDNVPGVKGVGEKTAMKLIAEWGSLENVLAHTADIPGKLGEKLRADADMARLSKTLVTIHTDMALPETLEDCLARGVQSEQFRALCEECEFTNALKTMLAETSTAPSTLATQEKNVGDASQAAREVSMIPAKENVAANVAIAASNSSPSAVPLHYTLVCDAHALQTLAARIEETRVVALDTETIGLKPHAAVLVGISCAVASGESYYIPIAHDPSVAEQQLALDDVRKTLAAHCANPDITKYVHHAKFDLPILERHGLPVRGVTCDTMLLAFLHDVTGKFALDDLAWLHLGVRMQSYRDVVKHGQPDARTNFSFVPLDEALAYAGADADMTLRLAEHLLKICAPELVALMQRMEIPLASVLADMEAAGILVDITSLAKLHDDFTIRARALEQEICALAGETFNVASPKQLGVILFEKLQLTGGKKTKTGYSTSADILEAIADQHALPRKVLALRGLTKLLSTYVDTLPTLADARTGRIHTSYHQTGTTTGRLSSSDPNLQNIPIRTVEGRKIRAAFIAPTGSQLLSSDYSQIELRILAHVSGDAALTNAFLHNLDVHAHTAAHLFKIAPDQISDEQRAIGKTLNFSVIYGQTPYGLAQQLQISPKDAAVYIAQYLAQYPGVAAYRERVLARARDERFVATLYGRRRPVTEFASKNPNERSFGERIAFNTIIQGTAADVMKLAMLRVHHELRAKNFRAKLLLQVHDELVLEVPNDELTKITELVRDAMETVAPPSGEWNVPIKTALGAAQNWAEV